MKTMFLIMVLGVWYTTSVTALDPNIVIAASNAIMAGTSVASTTMSAMSGLNYAVVCGIEVENWTKYTLSNPNVQLVGGALVIPPTTILPGRKEAMVARKTDSTATGSYGTVSWRIDSGRDYPPRLAVVMWSVPFDVNAHDNYLGLMFTQEGITYHQPGRAWFDYMYYGVPSGRFARKNFRWNMSQLMYQDDHFEIVGTMSSSRIAKVRIIVSPKSRDDLAESIKALMPH